MGSSILHGKLYVLPLGLVCLEHFLPHDNIVMHILDMGSSNDEDSKNSYSYNCIVVDLELFMLLVSISFVLFIISFFDLYSIIGLSIVMEMAGFSSTGFVSPVPFFINDKGNVYPFSFVKVLTLIIPGDTEVKEPAYEVVSVP